MDLDIAPSVAGLPACIEHLLPRAAAHIHATDFVRITRLRVLPVVSREHIPDCCLPQSTPGFSPRLVQLSGCVAGTDPVLLPTSLGAKLFILRVRCPVSHSTSRYAGDRALLIGRLP